MFLSIGINGLALVLPLSLLQVYDRILPNQSAGSAVVVFSAVIVALCLSGVLRYVRSGIFAKWSAAEEFAHWSRAAAELIQGGHTGTEAHLLAFTPARAKDAYVGQTTLAMYDAPFSVVFVLLIAFMGGIVVAVPLLIAALALIVFVVVLPKYHSALESTQTEGARYENSISTMIRPSGNVRSLELLGNAVFGLARSRNRQASAIRDTESVSGLQMDFLQSGALLSTLGVVWLGAGQVLAGEMTTGGLAACTLLGSRASSQLVGIAATVLRRQPARVALSASENIYAQREMRHATYSPIKGDPMSGGASGDYLFEGSADPSGAQQFETLVNAIPLGDEGSVRLVPARPKLVAGRLIDTLSRLNADDEGEALQIAQELGLARLVNRLPYGYETEISTHGDPLSEGGIKCAGLVQAFVGNPKLVVLETPEASLDVDTINRLSDFLKHSAASVKIVLFSNDQTLCEAMRSMPPLTFPEHWIEGRKYV